MVDRRLRAAIIAVFSMGLVSLILAADPDAPTVIKVGPKGGARVEPVPGDDAPAPLPAAAGRRTYRVVPNTNALLLMPELKDAPAPAWVKPGLRLTVYGLDGRTKGSGFALVPVLGGKYRDRNTGRTYKFEEVIGVAGHGITQTDVVAVHDDAVVVDVTIRVINDVTGPLILAAESGVVTTPGAVLDSWIHPDVLRKYLGLAGEGVTSSRARYKAAGKTWDAVWQQVTSGDSAVGHVYDVETGLMLHSSTSSTSKQSTITIQPSGERRDIGGEISMAQQTLISIRQVNVPWTQGRLPAALDGIHQLRYEGSRLGWLPDGSPMPAFPIRSLLRVIGRGSDFVQFHNTCVLSIGGVPSQTESDVVTGPGLLTPLAVEPADLDKLKQGQVLDRDPATKAVTQVSFIGRDKSGREVVVLSEAAPGENQQQATFAYDRASGLLVASSINNPVLHQITNMALAGKE